MRRDQNAAEMSALKHDLRCRHEGEPEARARGIVQHRLRP